MPSVIRAFSCVVLGIGLKRRQAVKQEVELKLELSQQAAEAFEQLALLPVEGGRTHLQAVYFDTPDRQLEARGYTLRIRRSGRSASRPSRPVVKIGAEPFSRGRNGKCRSGRTSR